MKSPCHIFANSIFIEEIASYFSKRVRIHYSRRELSRTSRPLQKKHATYNYIQQTENNQLFILKTHLAINISNK